MFSIKPLSTNIDSTNSINPNNILHKKIKLQQMKPQP